MDKISVTPLNPPLVEEQSYLARVIYASYRQCYSKDVAHKLLFPGNGIESIYKFIQTCMDKGHLSPLEHISVTFAINGVPRAMTHQLVRHRLASYSQQSQRYNEVEIVKTEDEEVIWEESVYVPLEVHEYFEKTDNMDFIPYVLATYKEMVDAGVPREKARFILPEGTRSNLVMTTNLRSWLNICNQRLCASAQDEIREVIGLVGTKLITMFPFLEGFIGPKCIRAEKCLDGKNKGELCEEHYAWRDEPWEFK